MATHASDAEPDPLRTSCHRGRWCPSTTHCDVAMWLHHRRTRRRRWRAPGRSRGADALVEDGSMASASGPAGRSVKSGRGSPEWSDSRSGVPWRARTRATTAMSTNAPITTLQATTSLLYPSGNRANRIGDPASRVALTAAAALAAADVPAWGEEPKASGCLPAGWGGSSRAWRRERVRTRSRQPSSTATGGPSHGTRDSP